MLFFGDAEHATTTSYGNVRWSQELFGIPAQNTWVYFRVTDFYLLRRTESGQGLLSWNLMMIDWADLFRQVGRPVLPPAALPEGLVLTAAANDGVPAPLSVMVVGRNSTEAKLAAEAALDEWVNSERSGKWIHDDLTFYGPGGIGRATSRVIKPFREAFADRSVEKDMLFCEGNYCAACGKLWGKHVGTWVGQTASEKHLFLRFGMHWRMENGKVREGWAVFDFPGLLKQLGKDFFEIARRPNQIPSLTAA
ncbi:styx-b [Symbiodinium pilosum]|uniref:Styx-b protein n=1 Tax=Symbiodinium pilosum TaxID=2952 RepID=A0A812VAN0_SYMPI|nr:styx-b [Symbiodinium pilosum]